MQTSSSDCVRYSHGSWSKLNAWAVEETACCKRELFLRQLNNSVMWNHSPSARGLLKIIHSVLNRVTSQVLFNRSYMPTWHHKAIYRARNIRDLDFDISRSLKVDSDFTNKKTTYGFLLVFCSNLVYISHRLPDTGLWKCSSYLLTLGRNFGPPTLALTLNGFFSKSNHFFLVW